jgi:hypothetical protein
MKGLDKPFLDNIILMKQRNPYDFEYNSLFIVWQRFKSYTWIGIIEYLIANIVDCLLLKDSKDTLLGFDVLITSHQKFITVL